MVETKEDAKNAVRSFRGGTEDLSSADVRGPYMSPEGSYFTVEYDGAKYNVFKSDGRVENA